MKVGYKTLLNKDTLVAALVKVYNCTKWDTRSAYKIKRMCDGVRTEMKTAQEALQDIYKLTDEEEKKVQLDALLEKHAEVKFGPMTKEEFDKLDQLSPMDLTVLEDLVDPSAFSEQES